MEEQDLNLLKTKLQEIKEMGWIKSQRLGNAGGVGNTLEDLLGIPENNLQLPDFGKFVKLLAPSLLQRQEPFR